MRRCRRDLLATGIVLWAASSGRASAQEHVTLRSDVLLYGDNTEFRNPFREGETILGAAVRLFADVEVNPRLTISLGAFGNQRFGSDRSFEQVRPIVSLTARGRRSAFVFGTLPAPRSTRARGPDRQGPHGLLPPFQRETLTFDRPYEAGLLWTFSASSLRQDIWLSWQRLNTPEHRERFDAGLEGAIHPGGLVSLPVQLHVVHEGGQLFASGPVADSAAAGAGVRIGGRAGPLDRLSIEAFGVGSRFVPDRSRPASSRDGVGFFGRASAERAGWRGHLIMWRGRNFIKAEGDPNYLSIDRGGARYRGTRDYAEAGLSRSVDLAPTARIEISGRLHRIEHAYEYSYRVLGVVSLRWPLTKPGS